MIVTTDKQSYPIEHCYSEIAGQGTCQLQFVSYILYVVIGCNLIKLGCMAVTTWSLWNLNEPIFATVGDAVVSYMERPDETTEGWCLMDLAQVGAWQKAKSGDRPQRDRYHRPPKGRLYSATSKTKWFTTIILCTLYLTVGIVMLNFAITNVQGDQIWYIGFGAITEAAVLDIRGQSSRGLIEGILTANSFQLALSTTYFLYNALYTAQCGALEWSTYSSPERKPLRVTWPHGQQKSTYYLSLPYRYGLPLTIFLMVVHFLISQSIFLARVQWYDVNGNMDESNYIFDVGFSPIAILVTICIGGLLIIIQIVHSFRPLDNHIPIHGNSSAVISAMRHSSNNTSENDLSTEENVTLGTVMWGAVVQPKDENEVGHCSFTGDSVENPVIGFKYR